jgi:hypothetical protein
MLYLLSAPEGLQFFWRCWNRIRGRDSTRGCSFRVEGRNRSSTDNYGGQWNALDLCGDDCTSIPKPGARTQSCARGVACLVRDRLRIITLHICAQGLQSRDVVEWIVEKVFDSNAQTRKKVVSGVASVLGKQYEKVRCPWGVASTPLSMAQCDSGTGQWLFSKNTMEATRQLLFHWRWLELVLMGYFPATRTHTRI